MTKANFKMRGFYWAVLAMIAVVASSNYLVEFPINDWLTYAAFAYPLSFFVTEITNYIYGPRIARRVVYVGFSAAIVLCFVWANPLIAFASSLAFLVGQLLDISIFSALRRQTWWLAPAAASILASFIDTAIFFSIAFYGEGYLWLTNAIGDFSIKMAMDILMLLPFRLFLQSNPKIRHAF